MERYLDSLEGREAAAVADALRAIQEEGIGGVRTRQIEGKLWEVKVSSQRVFYVAWRADGIGLLHTYKKQGQKAPKHELDVARARMKLFFDAVEIQGR